MLLFVYAAATAAVLAVDAAGERKDWRRGTKEG
jgi:hypothetical protein